MKIVTAAQMRALDRAASEGRGLAGRVLMERAGTAVAEAAARLARERPLGDVVIVCGRGNNGGDGFVAARHLVKLGFPVRVLLVGAAAEVAGDAQENLQRLQEAALTASEVQQAAPVAEACRQASVVVDALLGTGLSGEVRGLAAEVIQAMNEAGPPVLAVDIPSGLEADTGAVLGVAVRAVATVTMGLPKLGLYLYPGMDFAGEISVADIGFPDDLVAESPFAATLTEAEWVGQLLPRRVRSAHKGDLGRVLLIAGSVGMTGAATLAAEAALRAGTGLAYVGVPESLNDVLEVKLTEALTYPLPETPERSLHRRALDRILARSEEMDALAIGPGVSRHPETAALIRELVARVQKPFVLDADGLNAVAEDPSALEGEHAPCVLTPHPGEMSRLLGLSIGEVQAKRLEVARAAAARFRSTVVLKGQYSVVADAERLMLNPTGNPGMATGGTGDVLTGVIASLIGQHLSVFKAAAAGAYLQGLAGDVAAEQVGPVSLLAGDLVTALPEAFRRVRRTT